MLDKIKSQIYLELEMLFAEAAANELTNDFDGYWKNAAKIATVAEALGLPTEQYILRLNLKQANQ